MHNNVNVTDPSIILDQNTTNNMPKQKGKAIHGESGGNCVGGEIGPGFSNQQNT